ncbi:MAG: cold-shock protein [Pseudomonadota bacterium]
MSQGTVKWFNATKGYGFIKPDDSEQDAFVHISAVQKAGLTSLQEGQRLSYDLIEGRNGRMAADNLKVIG